MAEIDKEFLDATEKNLRAQERDFTAALFKVQGALLVVEQLKARLDEVVEQKAEEAPSDAMTESELVGMLESAGLEVANGG